MKLENITMNGAGWRKYFWVILVEVLYLAWSIRKPSDGIFMKGCTMKNFYFVDRPIERNFYLFKLLKEHMT